MFPFDLGPGALPCAGVISFAIPARPSFSVGKLSIKFFAYFRWSAPDTTGHPAGFYGLTREEFEVWFITYQSPARADEAVTKFVLSEAEAITEGQRLKSLGYAVMNIAPTTKARVEAFLSGALSDPRQDPLRS
jgi:hypothetical protein